ncbi:MAG: bifunctional folylpolyglutamate synthase/dihydrofolate synthase [Bacteroidota bacterium]
MTYLQTIDYLFTRLPMFSRIGAAAYKKDLTNTITLCEHLGNPQQKFKSIHVAGTNGKGSVSHMLAAVLQTAGYKTGLYTSPHLKDFRERIKVNGQMVNEQFVIDFTERIKPMSEQIEPSFFELTVAMAFEYFAEQQVDIAIIEVGLGGRLDSTNIITPELSVITNIGLDHTNMLGNTLEKIAGEKAGIIKEKVPVVIGEVLPGTLPVFEKTAREKNASLTIASQQRQVTDWRWEKHQLLVSVADDRHIDHNIYHLDLPGIYQTKNLLTVLEACSLLHQAGWRTDDTVIHPALKQVKKLTGLHGRWEVLRQSPLLVLDVAHNADGIRQLAQQTELTEHKNLHIIIGMVRDKDIDSMLHLLPKHAAYYFTKADIPRAFPQEELRKQAASQGLKGNTYSTVNTALYAASLNAGKDDMIIVCGSIFLVGEISMEGIKAIWGKDEYSTGGWEALEMAALAFFR